MIIPTRKKPLLGNWQLIYMNEEYTAWQCGYLCALSSVVWIHDETAKPHYEWLVSFTHKGTGRLNNKDIKICLKQFGIEDFEEDNHERGRARKFWLAVETKYRRQCPCKDETIITEGDYQYSIKK